jgi:hypothetical protein
LRKYFIIGVADDFNKERPTFVLQFIAIANQASEIYWYLIPSLLVASFFFFLFLFLFYIKN